MSRTDMTIIHCDQCGETADWEQFAAPEGEWFTVRLARSMNSDLDFCSTRCLLKNAGALFADGTAP